MRRADGFATLPEELWNHVLSFVDVRSICVMACTCSEANSLKNSAAHASLLRSFPQHAQRTDKLPLCWQQRTGMIGVHQSELAVIPSLEDTAKVQKAVDEGHRRIATEWLVEVAWDWKLPDSTSVYTAVALLDHFLATNPVEHVNKFQLVVISALRAAMQHTLPRATRRASPSDPAKVDTDLLQPKRFADVTAGACTQAEVVAMTQRYEQSVPKAVALAPTAKLRLRRLWYKLLHVNMVQPGEVHVYMLASFLLQLSLLDAKISHKAASLRAVAALSTALRLYQRPAWGPALDCATLWNEQEAQEVGAMMAQVQATASAPQLRNLWLHGYEYSGRGAYQADWDLLKLVISQPSRLEDAAQVAGLPPAAAPAPAGGAAAADANPAPVAPGDAEAAAAAEAAAEAAADAEAMVAVAALAEGLEAAETALAAGAAPGVVSAAVAAAEASLAASMVTMVDMAGVAGVDAAAVANLAASELMAEVAAKMGYRA